MSQYKDDLWYLEAIDITKKKSNLFAKFFNNYNNERSAKIVNKEIYVMRCALQPTHIDEYYYEDLVGCHVFDAANFLLGTVSAVYNFGAGDILEIQLIKEYKDMSKTKQKTKMIQFSKQSILEVDTERAIVIIDVQFLL